ncbi:MAG TPA: universal stress protein [Gemmatimonadaceae bacterium]|nr:universal stress protein [Gemmatimonadaceae bacterium]
MTSTMPGIRREDMRLNETSVHPLADGPILVASDGDRSSLPALEAAYELSKRSRAAVRVIAVFEASPVFVYEFAAITSLPELTAGAREELLVRIRELVTEAAGSGAEWTIDLREGDPAREIVGAATEANARLLILGVRHRSLVDRLFARETSLRTLHLSRTPLLVVPEGYGTAPRHMLVATDFGPASVVAARTALELFPTVTRVSVVHVSPTSAQIPPQFAPWVPVLREDIEPGFERVNTELALRPGVSVESVSLAGKPSNEILHYARSNDVDLIVTGTRGAGFIDRLVMGSTSRGLLRGVPCAVLVVRARDHLDVPYTLLEQNQSLIPRNCWASDLESFSKRNLGRPTSIEVDDPALGAQGQESGYPLLGVAFDHNDQRVEIMVGDFQGTAHHLTRSIGDIKSIDILRDAKGRDWVLRIAHGSGQTILTLNHQQEAVRR